MGLCIFVKTAITINAVHGFELAGIWPINKHAFADEHFEPANDITAVSPDPGCCKALYSPSVLRSIPQPTKPTKTRKWKLQGSTILTSTQVKEEENQTFEKTI